MRLLLTFGFILLTVFLYSQSEGAFGFRRFATYSNLTATTVSNTDKNASRRAYVHQTGKYYYWDGTQWVEEKLWYIGKQGILVKNDSILLGGDNANQSFIYSNRYLNFAQNRTLILKGERSLDDLTGAPYIMIQNKMQSGDPFGAKMTFIDSVGSSQVGKLDIGSYDGGAFIYSNNWLRVGADTMMWTINRLQAPDVIDSTHVRPGGLRGTDINQMGATSGQALVWNGSTWTPGAVVGGSNVIAKQGVTRTVDSLFLGIKSNLYTVPTITDNRTNVSYSSGKGTVTMYNRNGSFLIGGYTDSTQVGGILTSGYPSQGGALIISPSDTSAYLGTTNGFSYTNIVTRPETIRFQVSTGGIVTNTITISDSKTSSTKLIKYTSKLHSSYDNRSLVDKEYIVNYIDTTKINPNQLEQIGATSGQVLKWNGSQWAPANDVGGGSGDNWGTQVVKRDTSLQGTGVMGSELGIRNYSGASNGQVPSKSTAGITWIDPVTTTISGATTRVPVFTGTNTLGSYANLTYVSGINTLSVLGTVQSNKQRVNYETVTTNGSTLSGNFTVVYCNISTGGASVTLPLDANVADGDYFIIYNLNNTPLDVNRNGTNQNINGGLSVLDIPKDGHITLHARISGITINWQRHE